MPLALGSGLIVLQGETVISLVEVEDVSLAQLTPCVHKLSNSAHGLCRKINGLDVGLI